MRKGLLSLLLGGFMFFAGMPSSTDYTLHNYGFGSGGTSNSSSADYSLNGISGETSNVASTSTNYQTKSGNNNSQQANVPAAPTLTNPSSYYDKLKFVINPGADPSDYKFAIAISTDNFVTTQYVQTDDTIGSTFNISNFQTYTAWGGASGQLVIDLTPGTTYYMKVAALQGNFTQSQFGPVASAATVTPSITFSIATDSQPSPPFSTSFGNLLPATVTNASDKIWAYLSTNADSGAYVYIKSANSGLYSSHTGTTISSASTDLGSASTGYGAQGVATTQASGGPLSISTPYNVSANNVGILDTNTRVIFSSPAPITTGSGDFKLMAKAAATTPSSSDYGDTLTITAAGVF
jgi:hypothetical protein